ncbi:MAG: FAD-binding oxidoreductase [Spirochaetia bacterium]|jgi:Na+-transporting NADH:ubiquinone oxidoreductase subunit F|nr:FAD-binding oxidoreductase [Spirochaetia bacterium]
MIIIKAVVFINVFALVLSLIIIFLDQIISNYGTCTLTINNDKEIVGKGGKTLLRILFENKYFIPSACGGKGTCGYCRVRVLDEGIPISPSETLVFTKKELRDHFHLACQIKVKKDLHLIIPAEYLEIQEYAGEISKSDSATTDIKKIRIKLDSPESISYKPGQYVQIKVKSEEGLDFRAYSMASDPLDQGEIELNVKLIPDGLGSGYLHGLKPGDGVEFSGPYGDFYLRTDSTRKIICVAGGVGLAPLKSIIAWWKNNQNDRTCELYYGSRSIKDLYDHDLFESIAKENPTFTYVPALSMEDPSWTGEKGFIHHVLDRVLKEGEKSEAYLCGPPIMIDAVTEVLLKHGVPKGKIYYDKF